MVGTSNLGSWNKQRTHNQRPMMVVGDNLNAEDTLWLFNIAMENPL